MARRIPFRDFLSTSPLLAGLDMESRVAATRVVRPRPFQVGEPIFEQGDQGRACMLVLAGTVRIEVEEDGLRVPVAILGKGELVGMERLFDPTWPRHAWVYGEERGLGAYIPEVVYKDSSRLGHRLALNLEQLALGSLLRRDQLTWQTYAELLAEAPRPLWQGV